MNARPRPSTLRLTPRRAAPSRATGGESGATLIIAVLFMTVIMSLTVGLLGFAQVGARSHRAYKVERTNRYAIDSAINAGIQFLATNPDMGSSGGTGYCHIQVNIAGEDRVMVNGAYYTMDCAPTTPSSGGALSDSGKVVDGVQNPRDVTITISCGNDASNPIRPGKAFCGTGTNVTVATARVRFDRDSSPGIDPTKSAIVPKVLSWEIRN